MADSHPFNPGTLVRLSFQGIISDGVYGVEAYSEHYGGYLLISHDGRSVNAKEENVVKNDDDTFIFDIKQFAKK